MSATIGALARKMLVEGLDDLIRCSRDARRGYGEAAEVVGSSRVRRVMHRLELQHATFIAELERLRDGYGGRPEEREAPYEPVIYGWIDLPANAARRDGAVLKECVRIERLVLDRHRRLRAGKVPEAAQGVLDRQQSKIEAAVEELEAMLARRRAEP